MRTVESARGAIASVVGESRVTGDPMACAPYSVDGKPPRLVAYPGTAEQVAEVLRCAAEDGLAVIACRNATKLCWGDVPSRYDVALCLKEMNNVWHYEPSDLTVSVEAGMKFGDFQQFVGRHNLWLPLDPEGGARASLGGILATNSAGPLRHAYGSSRDMVLGMKIATTEGKVIRTGGRVVKNVAGYDLGKLLIGSYGTLGVIVEVTLKLDPVPRQRSTFILPTGTLGIARDLRRRLMSMPLPFLRMVLLDPTAASEVRTELLLGTAGKEPEIWIEAGGSIPVLERVRRELSGLTREVGTTAQELVGQEIGEVWDRIADFRRWMSRAQEDAIVLKVTLPVSRQEELLSRAQQEVESDKARIAWIDLLGTGLVYMALLDVSAGERAVNLIRRLRKAVEDHSGRMVIAQCAPAIKGQIDVWGAPGDDFEVMRNIKSAWDPRAVLSPGRYLGAI